MRHPRGTHFVCYCRAIAHDVAMARQRRLNLLKNKELLDKFRHFAQQNPNYRPDDDLNSAPAAVAALNNRR